MTSLALIFATVGEAEAHPLQIQGVGILIVLGALIALCIIIALVGKIFIAKSVKKSGVGTSSISASKAAAPAPAKPASSAAASGAGIPPHIAAVIAAAVVAELGSNHHIVNISTAPQHNLTVWSIEGRRQIYASHTIR